MKSSALLAVIGSLLSATSARSLLQGRSTPEPADIKTAVILWRNDTGIVSEFLNLAGTRAFKTQAAFHESAVTAYNAELDELTHKAVLDAELPKDAALANANHTLVAEGTFQSVVNLLNDLTTLNYHTQAAKVKTDVNEINFGTSTVAGRCAAVLPAIDTYFEQASAELEKLDGDSSLSKARAIRPTACSRS